jgi:polysaccharide export outer membrane protein
MTLLGVLARAGGALESASGEVVVAHDGREGGGASSDSVQLDGVRIDLTRLQAGARDLDIGLRDGDTVLVPRAERAYVLGEVRSPGGYGVQKNATLQQMLSLAGGLTSHASQGKISIDRDGKILQQVTLTEIVKPGDTITIPRRSFWR